MPGHGLHRLPFALARRVFVFAQARQPFAQCENTRAAAAIVVLEIQHALPRIKAFLATFAFGSLESTLALVNRLLLTGEDLTRAQRAALLTREAVKSTERANFAVFAFVGFVLIIMQGLVYRRLVQKVGEVRFLRMGIVFMAAGLLGGVGVLLWRPGFEAALGSSVSDWPLCAPGRRASSTRRACRCTSSGAPQMRVIVRNASSMTMAFTMSRCRSGFRAATTSRAPTVMA